MKKINQGKICLLTVVIAALAFGGWQFSKKLGQTTENEGDVKGAAVKNELPAGWPDDVPVYPEAKIELSGVKQDGGRAQGIGAIFITADSVQKAVDFFAEELPKRGWTLEQTAEINDAQILSAKKGNREFGLSAAATAGQTRITIAITTK